VDSPKPPTTRGPANPGRTLVRPRWASIAGRCRHQAPARKPSLLIRSYRRTAAHIRKHALARMLMAWKVAYAVEVAVLAAVSTFRFSGVADAQLRPDLREYTAVHGCVRALMTAVVAVMVAVRHTSGSPASGGGESNQGCRRHRPPYPSRVPGTGGFTDRDGSSRSLVCDLR
jgi:hypothetical protein